MRGEPPKGPAGENGAPQASPQGPQPSSEAQCPTASPHTAPEDGCDGCGGPQEDAASELATSKSLHEWARKLPQPARDKELPAARKRLELAEGEDKKRKPPAERLQSALNRVDHRQRQAQAERDALSEAVQAIEALKAECTHQDALLAKDQEELQVAQSLHQAWGPTAREGESASQLGKQPQEAVAAAEKTERQRDLLNRLCNAVPAGQGPDLLKGLRSGLPWHRCRTGIRPGAAGGPSHPGGRRLGGIRTQENSQTSQSQIAEPLRPPRGSGHRDGGPRPQLTGGPGGGGSRKDRGPPHRGGRGRTAMRRTKKPKRLPWGIILSLIVAPLGWGPPGAHAPPSPEPQAPPDQQLAEPSDDPGSRGTLQARAGEILYLLKPVENTGEFWTAPPPEGLAGGAARGFTSAQYGQRATHDRFQDVTHCPKHQEREEDTMGLGTDPPCQPTRCRPRPQEKRSHPGWPGWESPPGVPGLQPRNARDPNRGPAWTVAQAPEGQQGSGRQGTTVAQTQSGWCGYAATLPQHGVHPGLGPQETQGCTEQDEPPKPLGLAPAGKGGLRWPPPCPVAKCTQDGQGGLGPQESQGRTERQKLPGPMRSGPVMHPPWGAGQKRKPKLSSRRAVMDPGRVNLAKSSWEDLKGATPCVPKGASGPPKSHPPVLRETPTFPELVMSSVGFFPYPQPGLWEWTLCRRETSAGATPDLGLIPQMGNRLPRRTFGGSPACPNFAAWRRGT